MSARIGKMAPSCLRKFRMVLLVAGLSALIPSIIRAQDDDELFPIIQDHKIGYINKVGEIVISPRFDPEFVNQGTLNLVRFSEGLALANVKGKSGYIDKTGAVVILMGGNVIAKQ